MDVEIEDGVDVNSEEENPSVEWDAGEGSESVKKRKKNKNLGPLFDSTTRYDWKLCGGRSKQNYIPCIDMEGAGGRRHHERSCPRGTVTCLVPIPKEYGMLVPWPESKFKVSGDGSSFIERVSEFLLVLLQVLYGNVAHPKLSAFIKTNKFINVSGEYLRFPQRNLISRVEFNIILIRLKSDASFVVSLLEKDVITLSLGLMSDQRDLTQVLLERGIPSVMGNLGTSRLPFPAGVFDAVHCSSCNIHWHSNGGRLLLEINRILRPGGYFIISMAHGDAESEKGMSLLTASICWNVLAHKTDDTSELDIMIYQRPISNDIYNLRRRNEPPFCKDDENQDFAWYVPIKGCLHKLLLH
ncbi:hypothetical protein HPP92_017749 [Vanilla planifolia]|uniref:Methyltransferase n=1 Tax=Vanilla planifolia TaxID=51239 RepID=A0A835QAS6_VANPL|nr:hypothetical protein HPP92_017749 [Vanilla planifolia]